MPEIEIIHRARIDYQWTECCEDADGACNQVMNKAMKFTQVEGPNVVDLQCFDGCPACYPYVQIESENKAALERVAGKIERYINKLKAVELCLTG